MTVGWKWFSSVTMNGVSKLFNLLGPSDAIWWQRSGLTLGKVMAWCLTAPSHHMNQCWLIISKVEWHSSKGQFTRDASAITHWNYLEIKYLKLHSNFPGANELNLSKMGPTWVSPGSTMSLMHLSMLYTQIMWCTNPPGSPFYQHGLTLIPTWISNYTYYYVCGWNYLSIPKLQRCNRWSLRMDK